MNSLSSGRIIRRAGVWAAGLGLAAAALAQVTVPEPIHWTETTPKESWVSFSGAYIDVDGNTSTYQRRRQHDQEGFLGIDAFRYKRIVATDRILTISGQGLGGDNELALRVRYDNTATGSWLEAGWRESRVFYDGGGGFFPINNRWFNLYETDFAIDRGAAWVEGGLVQDRWTFRLRYAHDYREGLKDSTTWGDTNLTGLTGSTAARYIVPAFYDIDESRDSLTADLEYRADTATFGGGMRWENIETDDSRNVRRRPTEAADRYLTQRDGTDSDLFAVHGFTEMRRGEKLIATAAASHLTIDTNFTGSRIYGATYDPIFDPTFARRQARDEGIIALHGDSKWKQTVLTANALYLPAKHWRVNAGVRYENQTQDVFSLFDESIVGTTSALITAVEELEGDSARDFDEVLGSVEASYTGIDNWVFTLFGEAATGDGDLREELVEPELNVIDIARDTAFDRDSCKYGLNLRWYPLTNLNFAAGAYRKVRENDYSTSDDTTPNTGADRYPAYIDWQKFSTNDLYVRGTWRPHRTISVVTRYDYQQTDIDSREDGLLDVLSAEMTSHIISSTVNWTPLSNLVVQGSWNYVYDQIITGAADSAQLVVRQASRFDNNYRTASVLVFIALDDRTDLQLDGALFQSANFRDVSTASVAYGLTARDRSVGVSLNRRVNDDLQLGVRYARDDYDELTSGGNRDFTADLFYGRVQLRY